MPSTSLSHGDPPSVRAVRNVLLIDTCGAAAATVAVARVLPVPVVVAQAELPGRSSSERLLPTISELLAAQGMDLHALEAIAVVHGPGSFTGERVGLSAAKGLCEGLEIPLIAISRLAVLANKSGGAGPVMALLDAGRNQFYAGEYHHGRCLGEALRTADQLRLLKEARPEMTFVACELEVMDQLAAEGVIFRAELSAADALPLAVRCIAEGAFDDVAAIDANYVRRTDAEIFVKPIAPRGKGI